MSSGVIKFGVVPLRANLGRITLFEAMEDYLVRGVSTTVYAYYPEMPNYDAIPAAMRDVYRDDAKQEE